MRLHFIYDMKIQYTTPANTCHFTIKCIPTDDARQHLMKKNITVFPDIPYSYGEDAFGNRKIYGCVREDHAIFQYHIEGEVDILQTDYEIRATDSEIGMYRYPYGKCIAGSNILAYFHTLTPDMPEKPYETCMQVMHALYHDFQYVPSKTQIETTAEEAFTLGMGVCQDYAHIYITLLRLAHIPARYVCGLLIGEGKSHAWAEACIDGMWIGFDPTNDCIVTNNHIKLGHGRDASDCEINRGIMFGGGGQSQCIHVVVEAVTP